MYFAHLSGLSVDIVSGIPNSLESEISCSNWPAESKESIARLLSLYLTSATKSKLVIFCK